MSRIIYGFRLLQKVSNILDGKGNFTNYGNKVKKDLKAFLNS
jgi:hypothetical protein